MDSSGVNSLLRSNRAEGVSGHDEKGTGPKRVKGGDFVSEFLALLFAESSPESSPQQEAVDSDGSCRAMENSGARPGAGNETFAFRNLAQDSPVPEIDETGRQDTGNPEHIASQEETSVADGKFLSAAQKADWVESGGEAGRTPESETAFPNPSTGPLDADGQGPTRQGAESLMESSKVAGPDENPRVGMPQVRAADLRHQAPFQSDFEEESPAIEEMADEGPSEEDGVRLVREVSSRSQGDLHNSAEYRHDRRIELSTTSRNSGSTDTVADLTDSHSVESDFEMEMTSLEGQERLTLKNLDSIFDRIIEGGRFHKIGESFKLDIYLEPEYLGKVRIETVLDKENVMRAVIEAEDPAVRNLIEQKLPLLIERLQEDGIDLSDVSVQLMDVHAEGGSPRDENRSTAAERVTRSASRTGDDPDGGVQSNRSSYIDDGRIHYFA